MYWTQSLFPTQNDFHQTNPQHFGDWQSRVTILTRSVFSRRVGGSPLLSAPARHHPPASSTSSDLVLLLISSGEGKPCAPCQGGPSPHTARLGRPAPQAVSLPPAPSPRRPPCLPSLGPTPVPGLWGSKSERANPSFRRGTPQGHACCRLQILRAKPRGHRSELGVASSAGAWVWRDGPGRRTCTGPGLPTGLRHGDQQREVPPQELGPGLLTAFPCSGGRGGRAGASCEVLSGASWGRRPETGKCDSACAGPIAQGQPRASAPGRGPRGGYDSFWDFSRSQRG